MGTSTYEVRKSRPSAVTLERPDSTCPGDELSAPANFNRTFCALVLALIFAIACMATVVLLWECGGSLRNASSFRRSVAGTIVRFSIDSPIRRTKLDPLTSLPRDPWGKSFDLVGVLPFHRVQTTHDEIVQMLALLDTSRHAHPALMGLSGCSVIDSKNKTMKEITAYV